MNILLTGITGMAGSHLAEYLIHQGGYEVHGTLRWRSNRDNIIRIQEDPARMRPSDVPTMVSDNSKFVQETGWQPKLSFEESLFDLLQNWRDRVGSDDRNLRTEPEQAVMRRSF